MCQSIKTGAFYVYLSLVIDKEARVNTICSICAIYNK